MKGGQCDNPKCAASHHPLHVAAAKRQRDRRQAKGGAKGGKGGQKGKGPKKKRPGKGKKWHKGAAAEEADPAGAAGNEEAAGEDAWTGTGVEFETIAIGDDGLPVDGE